MEHEVRQIQSYSFYSGGQVQTAEGEVIFAEIAAEGVVTLVLLVNQGETGTAFFRTVEQWELIPDEWEHVISVHNPVTDMLTAIFKVSS